MKSLALFIGLCLAAFVSGCGPEPTPTEAVKLAGPTVVEAACGHCQLGLKDAKGCSLAIRYEGTSYPVDGFKLTDLGDPHAADGLCSKVQKAKVTGEIANGRFAATTFELVATETP